MMFGVCWYDFCIDDNIGLVGGFDQMVFVIVLMFGVVLVFVIYFGEYVFSIISDFVGVFKEFCVFGVFLVFGWNIFSEYDVFGNMMVNFDVDLLLGLGYDGVDVMIDGLNIEFLNNCGNIFLYDWMDFED